MELSARVLVCRASRVLRRADEDRRTALVEQVERYSPAQRRDLLATLDRFPDQAAHELREVICALDRQRPLRAGWTLRPDR